MTPDDLLTVQRSWDRLRPGAPSPTRRARPRRRRRAGSPIPPPIHAPWLCAAVDELVGLLAAPEPAGGAGPRGSARPGPIR